MNDEGICRAISKLFRLTYEKLRSSGVIESGFFIITSNKDLKLQNCDIVHAKMKMRSSHAKSSYDVILVFYPPKQA